MASGSSSGWQSTGDAEIEASGLSVAVSAPTCRIGLGEAGAELAMGAAVRSIAGRILAARASGRGPPLDEQPTDRASAAAQSNRGRRIGRPALIVLCRLCESRSLPGKPPPSGNIGGIVHAL